MKKAPRDYSCLFLINQDQEEREYEALEKEASRIFLDFIRDRDYGIDVRSFLFNMYVQPTVNYGRHMDSIYNACAHMVINIDKPAFDRSTEKERIRLLLNAAFILIKYLAERLRLPKNFNAGELAKDYEKYLAKNHLLIDEPIAGEVFHKYVDTTRFIFLVTKTVEVNNSKIHFDLNKIQDFINNRIAGKVFGKSIHTFHFGFELFDFNGGFAGIMKRMEGYKRYGHKYKNYLVVKQFDYAVVKNLEAKEQLDLLKFNILEGINDFDLLKKKPKDFDKDAFYEAINTILTEYEQLQIL